MLRTGWLLSVISLSRFLFWMAKNDADDSDDTPEKRRSLAFYYAMGDNIFDIDLVREVCRQSNAPLVTLLYPENGGGIYKKRGRWIIGAQGGGGENSETRDETTWSAEGGDGLMILGYQLKSRGPLRVYPLVGFGGAGFEMSADDSDPPPDPDAETEEIPAAMENDAAENDRSLEMGGPMMLFGFGVELRIWRFMIGFQVGRLNGAMFMETPGGREQLQTAYWRLLVGLNTGD